jgi:hypothetical protein
MGHHCSSTYHLHGKVRAILKVHTTDLSNKNPAFLRNSMLKRFTGALSGVKT